MATSDAELRAMTRALALAERGPVTGPNPRVGCVLLAADGTVIGEGWHAGAGTPHAEAAALADARERGANTRGATAVVTLAPCDHTGRTAPCSVALLEAGVTRVVFGAEDPNPLAAGGPDRLRAAGVEVVTGVLAEAARAVLGEWAAAVALGRPHVTLKTATSLDGRVAAPDGSSRWITSPEARAHAHAHRGRVDAIVVGTGTVLADDPALTARERTGVTAPAEPGGADETTRATTAPDPATDHQPLRVVVGHRPVPAGARLRGPGGELVTLDTHDPAEVLAVLHAREVRTVLVEGGPTLATAFLRAGLVDRLHAYVAPVLLGAGPAAVGDLGVVSIAGAHRWATRDVLRLGPDVLVVAERVPEPGGTPASRGTPESRGAPEPDSTPAPRSPEEA